MSRKTSRPNVPIHFEDKVLVKQLLAGDEASFEQFFNDNFARLYRFAARRLPDEPDVIKEIVHSTLSKALRNLGNYRGEAAMFTWLCAICRNEVTDWLRRRGRYHQHVVLAEDHPEIQAVVDSFRAPDSDDPEFNARRQEASQCIQVALDSLPPKYGNVLEWKYIEGYTVQEIAERLQLGREAAQSLLARAKRAFREVYSALVEPVVDGKT